MLRRLAFRSCAFFGFLIFALVLWLLLRPAEPMHGGKTVSQLAHTLHSADPAEIKSASLSFQALGSNAVPSLIRMLNAKDTMVRRIVWEKLGWLDKNQRVFLMRRVPPPQRLTSRLAALKALALIGTEATAAVPELESLLMNARQEEVFQVTHALGRIGTHSVPTLTRGLGHKDAFVRQASALALAGVGSEAQGATEALVDALADSDAQVSENAARALAAVGIHALPALVEELENGNSQSTLKAVRAIRLMRPLRRTVTPALHKLLQNRPDEQIRAEVILALGEVIAIDPISIEMVRQSLEDASPRVRRSAVIALGHFGSRASAALPGLLGILAEPDPEIRQETLISLGKIGGLNTGQLTAVKACLSDPDPEVRTGATNCLQRLGESP